MSDNKLAAQPEPASARVLDHSAGEKSATKDGRGRRTKGAIDYVFDQVPEGENLVEIMAGIYWARIPLPFSLNHINVYLFDEGDSFTLIDTGVNSKNARETWEAILQGPLNGKPIKRVIATHMHPDHLGLAGWIVDRFDAEFFMTQGEFLLAHYLWSGGDESMPDSEIDFMVKAGMNPDFTPMVKQNGSGGFKKGVHALPRYYSRLLDGSRLKIGGHEWITIIGRGHSPEHACLFCPALNLMIGGDQILPGISSNVSVYPSEPLSNPLVDWLLSLDRLRGLDADPVILPSHGKVFKGYHKRLTTLIEGHEKQLRDLHAAIAEKPRHAVGSFKALYGRVITGFDYFLALGEALAHLHLLESIGLAARSQSETAVLFGETDRPYPENLMAEISKLDGRTMRSLTDHGLPVRH